MENVYKEIVRKKHVLSLTWDQLAEFAGLTRPGLAMALKKQRLKAATMVKICQVLDIEISQLAGVDILQEPAPEYIYNNKTVLDKLKTIETLVKEIKADLGYL